jgi:hypothetical protein
MRISLNFRTCKPAIVACLFFFVCTSAIHNTSAASMIHRAHIESLSNESTSAAGCDRECLRGLITQYLDALIAHNPSALPVAPNVRFTEDTVEMRLGEGLWKSASRIRPYRQDFLDVRQGVAASHVVVEEGGSPVLLVLRLKVVDNKITEVETIAVRSRKEGMIFEPDSLTKASAAMTLVPEPSQLHSREEAIKIAERYPAGLKVGSFVKSDVPFSSDAYRFENGRLMAGKNCTFMRGCDNIKTQKHPVLSKITYRLAAVDEEMGIVLFRLDFGPGSTRGAENSLIVWEAFKVYGGEVHAVEAFMEIMPFGAGSGWDDNGGK